MKKRFNIDDYKGCYVMHCDTETKARAFCNYLSMRNKKWDGYTSYIKNINWDSEYNINNEIFYYFNEGKCDFLTKYINEDGYKILEFDDFLWGLKSKSSPKPLKVTAVDFVPPKTIVNWSDGSTTVVKCTACTERYTEKCIYCKTQSDWRESGIIHAMCKKAFSKEYFRVLDEYCEDDE